MKDITKLLSNRSNIRNIEIIGLPDDDDTEALKDSLLASSGILAADVGNKKNSIFCLFEIAKPFIV